MYIKVIFESCICYTAFALFFKQVIIIAENNSLFTSAGIE